MTDMDTPRLMVEKHLCVWWTHEGGGTSIREATIPEVIAWLREQGAVDYEAALTKFKTFWDRPFASPETDLETCKAMIDAALSPTSQEGE